MHGGLTPKGIASPHYKTGRYSKYAFLPDPSSTRLSELQGDLLKNLEDSLKIQVALETELLEQLGSDPIPTERVNGGNSRDSGPNRDQTVRDFQKQRSRSRTIGKIQRIQESQRKLTETFLKYRRELEDYWTSEEVNQFLEIVVRIIRNNVTDRATLKGIQNDLSKHFTNYYPKSTL